MRPNTRSAKRPATRPATRPGRVRQRRAGRARRRAALRPAVLLPAVLVLAALLVALALACRDDAPPEGPGGDPAKLPAATRAGDKAPTTAVSGGAPAADSTLPATATTSAAAAAPGAQGAADRPYVVGDLGLTVALPTGWTAKWSAGSGLLEVFRGHRRFYVERFDPAEEAGLQNLDAAVGMVESFREDGLSVTVLDRGPVPDGFFVAASSRDDMGREEPHLFVVRTVAGVPLVCRLGPDIGPDEVPLVKQTCESIAPN